jgi:flagellar motility protein MotE (MotC chaperone)
VSLDFATLANLRRHHPAWKLLLAGNAPLIASFLHRVFIGPNVRIMAQDELVAKLDDELFQLRESLAGEAFPRGAIEYLNDWADNERGWLRKFYPAGSDEPHFDLTPAAEKAVAWLESLLQRAFVGTESRLLTVFELLRQMVAGAEDDAETRISELERQKLALNQQIARIRAGDFAILDATALRDRFQQLSGLARELLGDFREVEHNFRQLDQNLREQIATWAGRKGELLEQIFGERDAIADSDQGKSFRAFWDFLMSPDRQEELTELLARVFAMESIASLHADTRLKRIHYDWLEAGEHTQRTVAKLSHQLRRYLDNQAYLENKRIMQLLQGLESNALAVRQAMPPGPAFMALDQTAPTLNLPMERPLYSPPVKPVISGEVRTGDERGITADPLFAQIIIDKARLKANIRRVLQGRNQVTLAEVLRECPLTQGLAEVITYFAIAGADHRKAIFDDNVSERICWLDDQDRQRCATLPRIIFNR